ncbi:MAG TPA: hypothetical protein VL337_16770 [Acidimicrobiales bacterium]|nr:hypothetical protein [Acidimicrobiales bacterium]
MWTSSTGVLLTRARGLAPQLAVVDLYSAAALAPGVDGLEPR